MSIVKQEQYDLELAVFQTSMDQGVQAMLAWLRAKQDRINSEWVGMTGEDLYRKQGEAQCVAKLIKMITVGPLIK